MSKELMGRIAALEQALGVGRKASKPTDAKSRLAAEIDDLQAQLDEELFDETDDVVDEVVEGLVEDDLTEEPTLDELEEGLEEASLEIASDEEDDDDEKEEAGMKASLVDPDGIEEEITQDRFSAVQGEQHGEQLASAPSMLDVGRQVGRSQVASVSGRLKEASVRLDRVAEYLEKHGRKNLAFRVDRIADAVDARLARLNNK